jgi:hypothetical protein
MLLGDGTTRAFLLTPVPEPATVALLILAGPAILLRRLSRSDRPAQSRE